MTSPQLLSIIKEFLARSKMTKSYFGRIAARDSKLVARLEDGGSVTLETADKILELIKKREAAK